MGASFDRSRVRALCFDIDGTLADTDDHIVARLAGLLDALPLVTGRRAERLARQTVMTAETPVNAAYAALDRLGLDVPLSALRTRLSAIRRRAADPASTRNPEAIDEVPHEMITGVQEMIVALAEHFPMCAISTGSVPRIERFLEHYKVQQHFVAVVGAQTTRRMKPHPEPLRFAASAMGIAPRECVMIGDTSVDMRTGKAAGAQTVGVLCGFGTERELRQAGAQLILRTTSDFLAVLSPGDDSLGRSASPTSA
jgi:HAD superfamily hydrolase (TIGR01549 family)